MRSFVQWYTIIAGFLVLVISSACEQKQADSSLNLLFQQKKIAAEIDSVLNDQYQLWYPRTVDEEYGGFLSQFSRDWQLSGSQDKFIVTQARHVWSSSKVARHDSTHKDFVQYGQHGFEFLQNIMWDKEYGGFYDLVSRDGKVLPDEAGNIRKQLYGNAFAIYGLASYYEVSQNKEALDLAKKAFNWLEKGSYDKQHGGYFNSLTREGQPYESGLAKDYNSGIHILEALAELYQVWPDSVVRDRLYEMFRIVRDSIVTDQGYMNLYFRADWQPVTYEDSSRTLQQENQDIDHITFGHDIETAFLLLEAAHALGFEADSTLSKAKKMVDHTIEHAWDHEDGGIYDYGYYFQGDDSLTVTSTSKEWWSQVEALHSLLIMARYFPDDPHNYFDLFAKQWAYIKEYMLDHEYGGWYRSGIDEDPEVRGASKASIWKGNYHTVRGLLRSKELLETMIQNRNSE
ncbi:AGE family epimerase/isomerase [Fodinibius salsisoli]|uniref:AGE family epimerase/isomerase n=1 Tax=Fodinibius salsisoli TaxID=2820877 RepID=A0ABT3PQ15_9BACT|nr:AGE family epimerase/isomerase [Fodinibius salsisoli]MCW9707954.1 AGE family epimerase/isomerase [Fodinibius salsisoli]